MNYVDALKIVIETIKNDEDLFYGFQSNIAMSFYDEYNRQKENKNYLNKKDIHNISNNAAINFLKLLIG